MTDSLLIKPFRSPATGLAQVPGSKSITNRALILAALADGETLLTGALFSRDTLILIKALRSLGFFIQDDPTAHTIRIKGEAGKIPAATAEIHVGNAGTAARFLTAFLTLAPHGIYSLDGDTAMRARPMGGLLEALESSGHKAVTPEGQTTHSFPFILKTTGRLQNLEVDASASSQMLSALLIVLPLCPGATVKMRGSTVSEPFVEMTEKMCAQFGRPLQRDATGKWHCTQPGPYRAPGVYVIEPDATAASYFIALPAVTGAHASVRLPGYVKGALQGDTAFAEVATACGADLIPEATAMVVKSWPSHRGGSFDFNKFSDTFLTLATLAPLASSPTEIKNIAHTRKQETDRMLAVATELERLGVRVEPTAAQLRADPMIASYTIYPGREALLKAAQQGPVSIHTYEDHRVAMSFGVLGSYDLFGDGRPWIKIEDPACTGKTFPHFFKALEALRAKFVSVAVDGGAASGKSSTSKALASRLGLLHVDTGAHYRSLTAALLKSGTAADDVGMIERQLSQFVLGTQITGNSARLTINGQLIDDVSLRTESVNASVSEFAALAAVRGALLNYQRAQVDLAKAAGFGGLIMEGRDIGSVVLPEATVRIFLQADAAARCARRASEGQSDAIAQRDLLDSTRKLAPLVCPIGSICIDNTCLTLEEVVGQIAEKICDVMYSA
jgi:3-phosphoshikimate 1-carboxyvinyltransferase